MPKKWSPDVTRSLVWPRTIRIAHWALVATTTASWLTRHTSGPWHEWLGYAALTIVLWRIVYGITGASPARFRDFVLAPRHALDYAGRVLHGDGVPYLGHNPLGGYMVVTLLAVLVLVSASGWLYTTDRFWGVAWVGDAHAILSNLLVVCIVLHLVGVFFTSWHERQNLVASMFHGHKRTNPRKA